jgi:phosphate uptake regulator
MASLCHLLPDQMMQQPQAPLISKQRCSSDYTQTLPQLWQLPHQMEMGAAGPAAQPVPTQTQLTSLQDSLQDSFHPPTRCNSLTAEVLSELSHMEQLVEKSGTCSYLASMV